MSKAKEFSYGTFALHTLGAGTVVLLLAGLLVVLLKGISPVILLVIALGGIVGSIAAMAFVSNRYLNRATSGDPEETAKPGNG